jgi:hypothetical protein
MRCKLAVRVPIQATSVSLAPTSSKERRIGERILGFSQLTH